jgi:hypothetical protein
MPEAVRHRGASPKIQFGERTTEDMLTAHKRGFPLTTLPQSYLSPENPNQMGLVPVVLRGLCGIRKAHEYFERHRGEYDSAHWVDGAALEPRRSGASHRHRLAVLNSALRGSPGPGSFAAASPVFGLRAAHDGPNL